MNEPIKSEAMTLSPLAIKVNERLRVLCINKQMLAVQYHCSRSMISQYLSGKYRSNPETVEEILNRFLDETEEEYQKTLENDPKAKKVLEKMRAQDGSDEEEPEEAPEKHFPKKKRVLVSSDYCGVLSVCQSCQDDMGLGIIIGRSGYGKTYALNGDWDRWAEFIIIINEDVANPQPTSTANLIREVRDKKESTSKDNYLIRYYADVWNKLISEMDTTYLLRSHFYKQRYLDGSGKLDGSRTLCGAVGRIELLPDYLFRTETQVSFLVQAFTEYTALVDHKTVQDQEYEVLMDARYLRNTDVLIRLASDFLFQVRETWKWHPEARNEYRMAARQEQDITPAYGIRMTTIFFPARHLDGSRKLDGSRTLSTLTGRIEARKDYLFDVYTVAQGSGSIG